jgi:D-alanyl-D-alanine carboxypeptidase/D-alanyl-D-alanine-endopeptidase (penicillin-binding protein 4)
MKALTIHPGSRFVVVLLQLICLVAAACTSSSGSTPIITASTPVLAASFHATDTSDGGGLDPRIVNIMDEAFHRYGEWGLLEIDPATGQVVHSLAPAGRFFVQGSVTKLFPVSAALDDLGFHHQFTTPVYALGNMAGGTLNGNLVLVAQGDLTMGGRTRPDGTVDFTNVDHTYANDVPGATLTPEDPLAGLNQLAQQVRASGITHVNGDVVIDARLFQPDPELDPVPVPITINDNLIDIMLTPGPVGGGPKSVTWRPHVAPYHLDVQVKTVAAGQPTALQVQTFSDGRILISGTIAADAGQQVRVAPVLDAASFARTALIEALDRAGISVSAAATGPNPVSKLPKNGSYQGDPRVAAYVSPPFQEYARLIFKVSHNYGANLTLCLMAVKAGSTNCSAGFAVMASFLDRLHVHRDQVALADGRGGNPVDRFTPEAVIGLLSYWLKQPEAAAFRHLLPILGETGGLSGSCTNCPAKGKVFAKTGTVALPDLLNDRIALDVAVAGYLEAEPGQFHVFDLVVNGSVVPDINSVLKVYDDLGNISGYLQEDAAS